MFLWFKSGNFAVSPKIFFMGVIKDADYEIEFHRLCRSILLAIRKFKMSTGVERCCVDTTDSECDEELNESSGEFSSPGRKLGIIVYVDEEVDSDDDDDE